MARGKKTRIRSKSQAKSAKRRTRQLVTKSKKSARPSKQEAAQLKRTAKKLRTATRRAKVKASTRKLPRFRIERGPNFNIFAPIRHMRKKRFAKIKRQIREYYVPRPKRPTVKQKREFFNRQKQSQITSLEKAINKRNKWLAEVEDADIPRANKRSARKHLRAELKGLLNRLEQVENELFAGYQQGNRNRKRKEKTTRKKEAKKTRRKS